MTEPPQPDRRDVRVLGVDDQRIICESIASLLSLQDGLTVVGMALNGQAALAQMPTLQPDIVLMDVRMPVMDGIAATREISRQWPDCQVLVLTTFDDEEYIVQALQAGAVGYLLKDIPAQDLAQAIHAAQRRMYLFDRMIAGKVMAALIESNLSRKHAGSAEAPAAHPEQSAEYAAEGVTSREIDVLRLLAQGKSNREIADTLVISEGTVKAHISSILSRLGLRDRT
ncbi:MAG: response regulator transcription factor [Chloroflexales bacterium]|nr:response regulator transcription factor [Chloroflexales bacterium]